MRTALSQWRENRLPTSQPCDRPQHLRNEIPRDEEGSKTHLQTKKKERGRVREYEQFGRLVEKGNAPKFDERIRRLTEGFKTGLVRLLQDIDAKSILNLWKEHFSNLMNGSENGGSGDGESETQIDDDEKDVPLPVHESPA
ncbi:uncharacterized protein LOC111591726 [Ceratitis capitata]|uniref:uncharacterized protein LOC111591726 n=1 Tax=Ceratitis capitata TaxID=7213 RepID=UPI000C6C5AFA|nr:uncharacterized protein LOC111591726 [Ceratitis capitata]